MKQRDGYVLMAALWLAVAVSAVALHAGIEMRDRRLTLANTSAVQHARNAAASGLLAAQASLTARLDDDRVVDPWKDIEEEQARGPIGAWEYEVGLSDAEARLNINLCGTDQLRRFLAAAGVRDAAASADAIISRRAAVGGFVDVREVAEVSFEPQLFAAVAEQMTVAGGGHINLNTAGNAVLLSLPGMTEQALTVINTERNGSKRIFSMFQIVNQLHGSDREGLAAILPTLERLTTVETRYALVVSNARSSATRMSTSIEAVFAREGATARLVNWQWR